MLPDPSAYEPDPTQEVEPAEVASADRHLLDAVIAKTTELLAQEDSQASLDALLTVARSLNGQPLTIDPVGIALVRASLATVLSRDAFQDELWETMTSRITVTLFDDPHSRARLETLWQRLQEGTTA
ncbi:MAG: hypothetical protein ABGZ17_26050 [Planctomycetaceae bacterium]